MKHSYQVGEIAKLYGIGSDSLRYYEKLGILKPRRGENGYRLYGLKDIYKLNIIRDLLSLGFSTERIRDYMNGQCVSNTLSLLQEEYNLLCAKEKALADQKRIIRERMENLQSAAKQEAGKFTIKTFAKPRLCVQLSEQIMTDEQMDFAFKRLHHQYEHEIRNFGNLTIGAYPHMKSLLQGTSNVYDSVFFILGQDAQAYDFMLPAGAYLSCCYRGSYLQNSDRMREFTAYAAARGLKLIGQPFELYEIDNHDTMREEEFLTKIQAPVEEQKGETA